MTTDQLNALVNQQFELARMATDLMDGAEDMRKTGAVGAARISYAMLSAREHVLAAIRRIDKAVDDAAAQVLHEATYGPAPW